nr:hypothetical protein [Elusimicrobiaceae bacterium]
MKKNENIYTSRYIQSLEDVYCHSRSAVTSEMGLSCGSASLPTRIINGGKKAIYTATMTAMLLNNMAPQAWADDPPTSIGPGQVVQDVTYTSGTIVWNEGTTSNVTFNGANEYVDNGAFAI